MGFRVLGALEVSDGSGAAVALRSAKQRRLLAALLVRAGYAVPAGQLADVLWADEQPAEPAGAIQTLVSRLRAILRSAGAGEIATRPGGYLLEITEGDLDAAVFARLVAEAHAVQDERPFVAAALLDEALGLWRGPPYMEFAGEEFVEAEVARLEGLRLRGAGDRVEVMLALGRHDEAIGFAEALMAEDPLRERPRAQLMLAHYRAGRPAEALETYRDYRGQLAEALGLDPSPELRDLEAAIIRQDPRRDRAGRVGQPSPRGGRSRRPE
ncbi:MAG: AfsR/SARP family transcriptional regulator [Egibacteraceae bacterium]